VTQTLLTKEGITARADAGSIRHRQPPDPGRSDYHPASLRTPLAKRLAWRDFLAIKAALARGAA
jgi:hypothetical protein